MPQTSRHILAAPAWPYANGPRHIGHVSGFGLPCDMFSRYQRMAGNKVLLEQEYYSVGGGFIEWKGYTPPKKNAPSKAPAINAGASDWRSLIRILPHFLVLRVDPMPRIEAADAQTKEEQRQRP